MDPADDFFSPESPASTNLHLLYHITDRDEKLIMIDCLANQVIDERIGLPQDGDEKAKFIASFLYMVHLTRSADMYLKRTESV